jgi:CRP-like cAMP-binding protein
MASDHHDGGNLAELATEGELRVYPRGATICAAVQDAEHLFLLRSGQVRITLSADDGRSLTVQVVEPGQIFGHMALVPHANYGTAAEATRPVEAVALAREPLRRRMLARPALALALLNELAAYRNTVSRRIEELSFKAVPARLASLLVHMVDGGAAASVRLPRRTHQQLADMIHAYRETVTKVINQFRDARLLDVDRSGITLLNLKQLRKLAQE